MKSRHLPMLLLLLMSALAIACGGSAATPTLLPSQTPIPPSATPVPPSPTPIPTETPIPPTATLVPPTETPTETSIPMVHISFVNDTGDMVCAIFFYSTDFSGDVPNLVNVEAGQIMMAGDVLEVDLPPGSYNASVWDCAGNQLQNFPFYDLQGEELTWALSQPLLIYTEALVTIVNQLPDDLCEFYVRDSDSTDWGENILAPEWGVYINSGGTYLHWVEVGGVYDFQLRYCDGTVARELQDQEVPSNMEWTVWE